jgi:polysaccharide export outer membrane protein
MKKTGRALFLKHWLAKRLLMIGLVTVCLIFTQGRCAAMTPEDDASTGTAKDYTFGPGDVFTMTVSDAPEFGGKFRVADSGTIQVTGVKVPVSAEGKTPIQLSDEIRHALMDAKQLRDPQVSIYIDEYHGRTVTVLGAVSKPAVYSLQKKTTVLDAVAAAGGALPGSGNTVTVVRGEASAEATGTPLGSVQILDIAQMMRGGGAAGNFEVRNGDVISVSAAQVVYVVGAVIKPGGYTLANPSEGVSVVQVVALAQGFTSVASTHHAVIVRQSTNDQVKREIPVDIDEILNKHATDVLMAPNDILYIPNSGAKQTLKVAGEIAMATINGIAIYGVGYKIGTSH